MTLAEIEERPRRSKWRKLQVRMPAELLATIREYARREDISINAAIVKALEDSLDRDR